MKTKNEVPMFSLKRGESVVIQNEMHDTLRAKVLQSDEKGATLGIEDGTTIDLNQFSDVSFGKGKNRGVIFFHG